MWDNAKTLSSRQHSPTLPLFTDSIFPSTSAPCACHFTHSARNISFFQRMLFRAVRRHLTINGLRIQGSSNTPLPYSPKKPKHFLRVQHYHLLIRTNDIRLYNESLFHIKTKLFCYIKNISFCCFIVISVFRIYDI